MHVKKHLESLQQQISLHDVMKLSRSLKVKRKVFFPELKPNPHMSTKDLNYWLHDAMFQKTRLNLRKYKRRSSPQPVSVMNMNYTFRRVSVFNSHTKLLLKVKVVPVNFVHAEKVDLRQT